MTNTLQRPTLKRLGTFFLALTLANLTFGTSSLWAQTVVPQQVEQSAATLIEKYEALTPQLAQNVYGRPLYLESSETPSMVSGNAYAVLESPFGAVSSVLKSPVRWCDVMILHINTKYCKATPESGPNMLSVNIGKKTEQDLADTFALEFAFRTVASAPGYLALQLNSDKGPLGTNNYRIEIRAIPLPDNKTFMHLRYSYGYGVAGKLAMQGYLATLGRGKVGFTPVGQGQNQGFVGGMRGAVERNTMRYYLAIDAYLATMKAPAAQQFDARLNQWFRATEQYSRQLHEVELGYYLTMKKNEYQRQQAGASS